MKNIIKITLIILLVAIVVTTIVLVVKNSKGLNYDISSIQSVGTDVEIINENIDSVTIKKKTNSDFTVMMFTDTHLNGDEDNDNMTIKHLVENITKEKPDLVIFGGDNISSGFSKKRTKEFTEIMEKLGVYWAAVLGNHDGEGAFAFSRQEIIELYASCEHSLVRTGEADIDGYGNFTINILNSDDTIKEVFYLMDSGDYMTKEIIKQYNVTDKDLYDGVKRSQVEWYKNKHDELKSEFGEFKSITVMHIPPYQTRAAAETGEFPYGEKREEICSSGFDSGLFNAMKEKGSAQAVYYGHDHINDMGVVYDGILLSYIQSACYGSYNMKTSFDSPESEWLQGCTVLNIKENGEYEAKRILNHKS